MDTQLQEMFDTLAPRYDRFNGWASLTLDRHWRRRALRQLSLTDRVLDLGCGTGHLGQAARRQGQNVRVVGVDCAWHMLSRVSRNGDGQAPLQLVGGDAATLPFASGAFSAVVSAYVLRNLWSDMPHVLREVYRVLQPGGVMMMLDLGRPHSRWFNRAHQWYLRHVIPHLGQWVCGERAPFDYLARSIETFPDPCEFAGHVQEAGFINVDYQPLTGGIVWVYRGQHV